MKTNIYTSSASITGKTLPAFDILNQNGSAVPAHKNNTGQPVVPGLGNARPESANNPLTIPDLPAKNGACK